MACANVGLLPEVVVYRFGLRVINYTVEETPQWMRAHMITVVYERVIENSLGCRRLRSPRVMETPPVPDAGYVHMVRTFSVSVSSPSQRQRGAKPAHLVRLYGVCFECRLAVGRELRKSRVDGLAAALSSVL